MTDSERTEYELKHDKNIVDGDIKIADEVIASIAAMAAAEIEGVAHVGGYLSNEVMNMLGMSKMSKGVKIDIKDGVVSVDINLGLEFGYPIPKTCEAVQKKIKTTIENMTALTVNDVNTHISAVDMNSEE